MNENYDDLFNASVKQAKPAPVQDSPRYSPEEWAAMKKQSRDDAFALANKGAESIAMSPSKMELYLDMQARFPHYSVKNVLLLMEQCPEATQLKDFNGWKAEGIFVKKGATGLTILEPGKQYTGDDGRVHTSFNTKTVFDISQVHAPKAHTAPEMQDGTMPERVEPQPVDRSLLLALIRQSPVEIEGVDKVETAQHSNACYQHQTKRIQVQKGMPAEELFQSLAREIVHAEFGRGQDSYSSVAYNYQARCAAYLICRHYQVDASCFAVGNAPSGMNALSAEQMQGQLSSIREAAGRITNRVDKNLQYAEKQAGKER